FPWRSVTPSISQSLLSFPNKPVAVGERFQKSYTYPGDDKEECLIGTWFGKKSIKEDRLITVSLASKMVESAKFQAVQ
ncbi:hypothetical protein ACJX0J_011260, partial [Zea mays]